MHRSRTLLHRDAKGVPDRGGIAAALTIWRDILVSGFIEATISTIWNRACLALITGFWPVMRIIGMAPRWA
jgi:hypothetical protein